MATSGSTDFSVSRNNLIYDALMMAGAMGPDDTPSANQVTHAARILNMLVKAWQGKIGIGLWARKTGHILPVTETNSINLGPTGGHATNSYVQTNVASGSGTSIIVDSATGISNTYYIGVEQDDDTMHWTTVAGVSGTTITLTDTLTDTVSDGNYVYVYQTKVSRPLHISHAYLHDEGNDTDIPVDVVAKADYDMLGNKTSDSQPYMLAYDPQLDNGVAYVFPQFLGGSKVLTFIYQRPFEDFDASTDTPDFPQGWYLALCYGLAVILAPTYGLPVNDRALLNKEATAALNDAEQTEPEDGSFQIMPDNE